MLSKNNISAPEMFYINPENLMTATIFLVETEKSKVKHGRQIRQRSVEPPTTIEYD